MRGDVFVARVFDNEDDFKRLDFTLSEVSSNASWIKEAATQNEKKRKVGIYLNSAHKTLRYDFKCCGKSYLWQEQE